MEDKTTKTIDFLRARLLAERSVSRTARQRAYELAKRVTELEKQLKFVTLQRKKAEKATVDVLLILENHGRNDIISEQFDSSSDQDEMSSQHGETSTHVKQQHQQPHESDLSSSEVESSRSLSWKSSKNSSSRFLEKKYTDASRRRRNSSFNSTGSSPRRVGKSCRQIRHREHRSAGDMSQNDDVAKEEGRASSESVTNHGSEKDMEKALENQAKFIARYEDEEKAQREWEDKFRENNGSTPDSCDPGTHSDVTEERDEIKAPVSVSVSVSAPVCNDEITPGSQEKDEKLCEETEPIVETKNSDIENKVSDNQENVPDIQGTTPRHVVASSQETSNELYEQKQNHGELGSVLEALQQAKLSLRSLEKLPLLQNGPSVVPTFRPVDKFPVPFSPVGLFRLPSDYEYGGSKSLSYDSRLSLTSQHMGSSGGQLGQFVSSPYGGSLSSSSNSLDDRFRMVPTFPYQETRLENSSPPVLDPRLGVGPPARDPRFDMGVGPPARDPRFDVGLGPYANDPRLDLGHSARDSRLGVGPSVYDPRLEMGPGPSDRYMRSVDGPLQGRSLYGDYMRPNTYK